jgi:hypothetical protein
MIIDNVKVNEQKKMVAITIVILGIILLILFANSKSLKK